MGTSRRSLLGVLAATVGITSPAPADDYPSKSIRLVVGFPPGGPTDIVGRLIGQGLGRELGQSVVIDNRGGAGGTIGAALVAKSKPDGYTLLVSVESAQTRGLALYPSLPYDQVKDFSFIRKVAKQHNLLVVHPSLPVSNVKELIEYLRKRPGEVNCGGTLGASSSIGCTLFDRDNDTKMTFINYPGGAQPVTDLISGTLQVGLFAEATVSQQVASGKLKAIAIAASERSRAFPNLPTIEQSGAKPMELSPWFGVVGPAGMPPAVVKKIGDALDRVSASPEFMTQLEGIGAVPIKGSTSDSFARDVAAEIPFWNLWAAEVKASLPK
ncbi:MAG: tripartite tricarboxylate transporter substrate binding protein [Rhodospirillales bacterium]|nr:tripartite tricarboxylate transporter substrate binding protein [Rhodospirillales bacterium]